MDKNEENWELMTLLHIPWHHAAQITDEEDRKFLMEKCVLVKEMMAKQRSAEVAQMEAEQAKSNIVTP